MGMTTTDIYNPIFTDKEAARLHLEATRWPEGAVCPHCQSKNVKELTGKSHRAGLRQCNQCRQQFTVTVGTVFERSKVPLNKWLLATHLLTASKKGMSAHQIHRMLGVTYKTAWFMCHRIREAMTDNNPPPLGGKDKTIEADETYFGNKVALKKARKKVTVTVAGQKFVKSALNTHGGSNKYVVVSLVERGGSIRSFHVDRATRSNIREILVRNADRKSRLVTDEFSAYKNVGEEYNRHETVNHSKYEYVRGDVYTNTLEGYYSIFKRGMVGTYQHCSESHLQRYVTEFDFRYNGRKLNDNERRDAALKGIEGKRLTYRRTNKAA